MPPVINRLEILLTVDVEFQSEMGYFLLGRNIDMRLDYYVGTVNEKKDLFVALTKMTS